MSNIDKRPYRADGGDIRTGRLKEIADNPYGDEEKCWLAKRVLVLLDEQDGKSKALKSSGKRESAARLRVDELLVDLEAAERRIAELELDETQLIEERDSAEKALADMYEAAMGERPEWSNLFGYAEAIDDVAQHVNFLEIAAVTGKGE